MEALRSTLSSTRLSELAAMTPAAFVHGIATELAILEKAAKKEAKKKKPWAQDEQELLEGALRSVSSSCYATPCRLIPCRVTPCHVTPCRVTPYRAMTRHLHHCHTDAFD
jgi:hypothetical protein